jgi:hypothetical protein
MRVAAVLFLGSLSACGGAAGSCDLDAGVSYTGYAHCVTYTGSNYVASSVMSACAAASAAYSAQPCAKSNGGTCTINMGQAAEYVDTYSEPPDAGISFEFVCHGAGGTYDAGAGP